MKRILLLFLVATGVLPAFGQVGGTELILYDAYVKILTNGLLFNDFGNGLPGYEVPAGYGNHAIYNAALWISGLDNEDNLRTTAITYCEQYTNGFCEFFPGPLTTDGTASTNAEVFAEYNRIWSVSRHQVEIHADYYTCLNDPDCDTETEFPEGYAIPTQILAWPAHGDTALDQPYNLAPFVDVDGDGVYQPESGDYPSFTGDEAVYIISNDKGGVHENSGGTPFGIEVHTMIYYYLDPHPALSRTVYVHQDIINRSTDNFHDVYLGIFNDFDLGNPFDDYIGTDVENSYVYVYNGDAFDESSPSGPGYGDDLGMMACKILAGPYKDPNGMDDVGPFVGEEYGNYTKGWNDGIVDNERLGLSGSINTNNDGGNMGNPETSPGFYNCLKSTWKNGVPVTFGGSGYFPADSSLPAAKYVFPGTSDPYFMGTEGVDPNYPHEGGWTEGNSQMPPGDRKILAASGPFSLNAGQKQSIDYVYVFARHSDDPTSDLHDLLTEYVNIAANQVDTLPVGVITSVKNVHPEQIGFGIYPNPAANEIAIAISGNEKGTTYRIFDILGSQVKTGKLKGEQTTVNISGLERGLYLVNVEVGNTMSTQKLIIE